MKFILFINAKKPTSVSILTFISNNKYKSESLKAREVLIFRHFSFHMELKFHAYLSKAWK